MTLNPKEVVLAKHLRVVEVMRLLLQGRYTVEEIADNVDTTQRTAYRYLDIIKYLDLGLEQDFNKRYFIASDNCPFCKQPTTTTNHL